MKKFYFSVLCILGSIASFAHVITGQEAHQLVRNANEVYVDDATGKIRYVHFQPGTEFILEAFGLWATDALGFKSTLTLELTGKENDELGMVHYRYKQLLYGKPVDNSMIIVHTLNGKVVSFNGDFYTQFPEEKKATLTESEALKKALNFVGASIYKWQIMDEEAIVKYIENSPLATYFPKGALLYSAATSAENGTALKLTYRFNVYAHEPMSRTLVYVDAETGNIVSSENLIHTVNVTGTAMTKYSGTRTIITDSTSPVNFRLRETTRGNGVETWNMKKGTSAGAAVDFTDSNNVWNNINANKDEVATDAHWGAEMVYDYYKITHNRNSINNAGLKLLSYVHYSTNYNNAFWNGSYMTYGDGNGTTFTPLTAIDVCGHEITHGLTSFTANLNYSNESGALNESFSDIFGTVIEYYGRNGAGNWKIGEDMTPSGNGIRSMSAPKTFSQPNTYKGTNWYTGTADNGGVHTNSGVQNYWFYLMSQGGSGTNDLGKAYNVPGMGMANAAKITFRTLTVYLTSTSQYADARFYSIQSAKDLFGACGTEVKTTTNTWYAVGVGNAFDSTVKAAFYTNDTIICGNTGTAKFNNTSTNFVSSFWTFGDGGTSTLDNPSHTYAAPGVYTIKLKVASCTTPVKYDSVTRTAYVNVSSTNPVCLSQKMPTGTGTGTTITLCNGKLTDDGGLGNYSSNVNSKRTIAPTNSGTLILTFNSFNFEANFDYLYLYDGLTTASPLIGKYTGTALPNGGTITCLSGAVTVAEVTDGAVVASGFDMDWKCYPKAASDISVLSILELKNARLFTPVYQPSYTIAALIKNNGTVQQSSIPFSYTVNGGTQVTGTYAGPLAPNDVDTIFFTTPVNNAIGDYTVKVFTTLAADTLHFNDTAKAFYRIVENPALTLPFSEGFEGMGSDSSYKNVFALTGARECDYDKDDTLGYARFRTQAYPGIMRSGTKAMTFDRNVGNNNVSQFASNFLTLTLNLSNYQPYHKIYLEFGFMDHANEASTDSKVWIRGSMNDVWIQLYDYYTEKITGTYVFKTGLSIDSALKANGQKISSSTQIKFGEQNNGQQLTLSSNDGNTFDDIRIYCTNVGITSTDYNMMVNISPNPAHDRLFITGLTEQPALIQFFDVTGKLILEQHGTENTTVNTSNLNKGIYILKISNEQLNLSRKIVIE